MTSEDGTDHAEAGAWRALLRAQNVALRAIEADLTAAGTIPLTWYDVLLELRLAPDMRLRMQELGERVVLSRTRVSRLVDELVAAGFVHRERCPDDGRSWFAVLTPNGRKARRRAAPHYLQAIDEHFNRHLTAQQKRVIERGLAAVVAAHEPSDKIDHRADLTG